MQLSTRPKVLMLDVDGVILRDSKVLQKVSHNIVHYFAKELHLPLKNALYVNQLLYSDYGHSYRGLRKLYNFDKSIHHFNRTVYTPEVINLLHNSSTDKVQHMHYNNFVNILSKCQQNDIPVYLFTNAPFLWCKAVLDVSGLDKYIGENNIISCDHDTMLLHKDDGFKPVGMVYETVKLFIKRQHHMDEPLCIFIEDSFKNLVPIINDKSWLPLHFNPEAPLITSTCSLPNMVTIRDVKSVMTLLENGNNIY
jgi:FMN phosphatase YigB (HAD superfamily)